MKGIRELLGGKEGGELRRSRTGTIAFLLTTIGVLLGATVDMAFLILAAAGIFGPNLLREFGWLRDRDEFQTEAARRAGHHAYLVGGLFTLILVIAREWGSADLDDNDYSAAIVLLAFLVPYMFSYLTSFWGARKAACRILLAFGLFWLLFNILGNIMNPLAMLMQCLVALPFFLLAWMSGRVPRVTGILLVLLALFFFMQFDMYEAFTGERQSAMAVILLLWVPLVYAGVSLLGARREPREA